MGRKMNDSKMIFCPNCHKRLMNVDRKSQIDKSIICRKCQKMIVYRVASGETEVKPIPRRTCASGMTFM